jgi:anti-anti-sigma regulatory factor
MRFRPCTVTVTQLPEKLTTKEGRLFFADLQSRLKIERPCIVLDCAKVRELDKHSIHTLLCCLEEAMKRDGDVKLASVTPSAGEILELTRVDRLFEIYETQTEAVNSFFRPHFERALYAREAHNSDQISESAA